MKTNKLNGSESKRKEKTSSGFDKSTIISGVAGASVGAGGAMFANSGNGGENQADEDVVDSNAQESNAAEAQEVAMRKDASEQEIIHENPVTQEPAKPEPEPEPVNPEPDPTSPVSGETAFEETLISSSDKDKESVLSPVGMTVLTNKEGEEIIAAVMSDDEGNQFFLTDANGDGYYNEFVDASGNLLGDTGEIIPVNLTLGDLENMYDGSGEYLGPQFAQFEPEGENPSADIINTDNSAVGEEIAMNEATATTKDGGMETEEESVTQTVATDEELASMTDEEIYQQLFGDDNADEHTAIYDDDSFEDTGYVETSDISDDYDDDDSYVDDSHDSLDHAEVADLSDVSDNA